MVDEQDEIRITLNDSFTLSANVCDEADWFQLLTDRIDYLIQTDFNKLVHILYRLDISEIKLSQMLKEHAETNAAEILARMIIERQREKLRARAAYKRPGDDIPDADKW